MEIKPIDYEALIKEFWQTAEDHGWHETYRSMEELVELIHTELSEAFEEYRNHKTLTEVYFPGILVLNPNDTGAKPLSLLSEEAASQKTHDLSGQKPEGIPVELADVFIRIADACKLHDINLVGGCMSVKTYWEANGIFVSEKRITHAFPLIRYTLSKALIECRKLNKGKVGMSGYYPLDCATYLFGEVLVSLEQFCALNDIEIADAISLKAAYNKTREYRHGGKKA